MSGSSVLFAERKWTSTELERLRLLLSTYQDGSGQVTKATKGKSIPDGWDFEDCVAALIGTDEEVPRYAKDVFDLVVPLNSPKGGARFGISCKMKAELVKAGKSIKASKTDGRAYLELSNAARAFSTAFGDGEITTENFMEGDNPTRTGEALIETVNDWHSLSVKDGIDLSRSCYLVLLYSPALKFKLFQFPITLPSAKSLTWYAGKGRGGGTGKHIKGTAEDGIVFEFYGGSGGQLKYYPKVSDAIYVSDEFELEPITSDVSGLLVRKAEDYFPEKWKEVNS